MSAVTKFSTPEKAMGATTAQIAGGSFRLNQLAAFMAVTAATALAPNTAVGVDPRDRGSISLRGFSSHHHADAEKRWSEVAKLRPRTALGRRLWALRQQIVASGAKLLSAEEGVNEVKQRRGEIVA